MGLDWYEPTGIFHPNGFSISFLKVYLQSDGFVYVFWVVCLEVLPKMHKKNDDK